MSFMIPRWMARNSGTDKPSPRRARWAWLVLLASLGCSRERPAPREAELPPAAPPAVDQPAKAPPAPFACPVFAAPAAQGTLRERRLDEISGLAHSSLGDHFWVHNDSGDEARIYALSSKAEWLATYRARGVPKPTDVEDLAVVQHGARPQVYLGDLGDNQRRRKGIAVHRFDEPELELDSGAASPHRELETGLVTTARLTYPDGAQDAEALLVDPQTGDLVIVTKTFFSPPKVYVKTGFWDGPLTYVGEMSPEVTGATLQLATAADVTSAGDYVAIRTYDGAYLFRRSPGQTLAQALLGPACRAPTGPEKQGEALALVDRSPSAPGIWTISEGKVTTLWLTTAD